MGGGVSQESFLPSILPFLFLFPSFFWYLHLNPHPPFILPSFCPSCFSYFLTLFFNNFLQLFSLFPSLCSSSHKMDGKKRRTNERRQQERFWRKFSLFDDCGPEYRLPVSSFSANSTCCVSRQLDTQWRVNNDVLTPTTTWVPAQSNNLWNQTLFRLFTVQHDWEQTEPTVNDQSAAAADLLSDVHEGKILL